MCGPNYRLITKINLTDNIPMKKIMLTAEKNDTHCWSLSRTSTHQWKSSSKLLMRGMGMKVFLGVLAEILLLKLPEFLRPCHLIVSFLVHLLCRLPETHTPRVMLPFFPPKMISLGVFWKTLHRCVIARK